MAIASATSTPGVGLDLNKLAILGTGFVVDQSGIVLTAKHVVHPIVLNLMKLTPEQQLAAASSLRILTEDSLENEGDSWTMKWNMAPVQRVQMVNDMDLAALSFPMDQKFAGSLSTLKLAAEALPTGG